MRYGDEVGQPTILDDVAAMIEAMPEGLPKEEARIEWDDATSFERLHPTLILIGVGRA